MSRIQWYGPTLLLLLTVLVVVVAGPRIARSVEWHNTDARIGLIRTDLNQSQFLAELSDSFRQVARAVEPSVVHIQILARPSAIRGGDAQAAYEAFVQVGSGSGWVYDRRGHIVTNHHVVQSGERIRVRFSDGSEYDAELLNADPATDVAVLKVDADNLHPAAIALEPAEQGDIVFAFGSPFHFDFSMSQGIVSGKGRTLGWLDMRGGYENYIQTDASINPGNSGGPLTNIRGEVIGMNSAIASRDGNFDGVGFAIPVRMVRHVADQLIEQGAVRRGYLGVRLPQRDLDEQMAQAFSFEGRGVLIQDLLPDGPAGDAGLQAGDIITHVEEQPVATIAQLRYVISSYVPGTEIDLTIFRRGDELVITVRLGELPQSMSSAQPSRRPMLVEDESAQVKMDAIDPAGIEDLWRVGVEGMAIFDEEARRALGRSFAQMARDIEGVIIGRVRPGSIAEAAGLRGGMIITHIGDEPVRSLEQMDQTLSDDYVSGDVVRLRVSALNGMQRQFVSMFAALELP